MKTFKEYISESQLADIKQLKPNTKISVFHGSTEKDIYGFCVKGVDATKRIPRHYNQQLSQGERGLFVTPKLDVAKRFGVAVIKFKVLGSQLKFSVPARESQEREYYVKYYSKSYKPEISGELLEPGEPQSLFIGTLSPRAIEKVYLQSHTSGDVTEYSREDYINLYVMKNPDKVSKTPLFEPQEKPSLKEFLTRAGRHFNLSPSKVMDIIKQQNNLDAESFSMMFGDIFDFSVSQHILNQL